MIPDVSVVCGTLNRLPHLQKMVESVRADAEWNRSSPYPYEIVLVDGGSTDGTIEWARQQGDVVLLEQGSPLGAVAAFNVGFHAARGEYVLALNDDAFIRPPVMSPAIHQLNAVSFPSRADKVGQIAIPFQHPATHPLPIGCQSITINGKSYLYANFSFMKRALGQRLGWWSDLYFQYGGDTHLSMAVWEAGFVVEELRGAGWIEHTEAQDDTRKEDEADTREFFRTWQERFK